MTDMIAGPLLVGCVGMTEHWPTFRYKSGVKEHLGDDAQVDSRCSV